MIKTFSNNLKVQIFFIVTLILCSLLIDFFILKIENKIQEPKIDNSIKNQSLIYVSLDNEFLKNLPFDDKTSQIINHYIYIKLDQYFNMRIKDKKLDEITFQLSKRQFINRNKAFLIYSIDKNLRDGFYILKIEIFSDLNKKDTYKKVINLIEEIKNNNEFANFFDELLFKVKNKFFLEIDKSLFEELSYEKIPNTSMSYIIEYLKEPPIIQKKSDNKNIFKKYVPVFTSFSLIISFIYFILSNIRFIYNRLYK